MKVEIDEIITIYVKKIIEDIETFILIINEKYNLNLEGFIDIDVYKDKYYGMIIEIKNIDYFDYFKTNLEMNINIINDTFLYEIENIPNKLDNINVYKNKDKLYIKPNNNFLNIIEHSKIIYGKKAKNIIKNMEVIV